MTTKSSRPWLALIPLPYDGSAGFLEREAGIFCKGFLAEGIPSSLITIKKSGFKATLPVQSVPRARLSDLSFWKEMDADGVVFYSWASPQYLDIAEAIRASGTKLVIKLDTDGYKSPRINLSTHLRRSIGGRLENGGLFPRSIGILHSIAMYYFPQVHDFKMLKHFSCADIVCAETPLAVSMLQRLVRHYGRDDLTERIQCLPHPANIENFHPEANRQKCILAIGRWSSHQKDAELLVAVLAQTLRWHPTYHAEILGSGVTKVEALLKKIESSVTQRILLTGVVPHSELLARQASAQILFMPSRWEGFPNSAAEAVCLGCSVVGPYDTVSSMGYFTSHSSGTMSPKRTQGLLIDALTTEIAQWESGQRDPESIAKHFQAELLPRNVIRKTMELVERTSNNQSRKFSVK